MRLIFKFYDVGGSQNIALFISIHLPGSAYEVFTVGCGRK
jgi:hypothetical protein